MNDDLISRKAFYEDFRNIPRLGGTAIVESENVALAIERAPAVNAVPVVRCKDCTFKEKAEVNSNGFRICPASGMEITDDDFCSYGDGKRGYLHDDSN